MIPERFRPLLDETSWLAGPFEAAGHRLYLVGGVVRDALLDRLAPDHDVDLTTDARPEEIKRVVGPLADAVWLQGERFGTIGATRDGRTFEITTHRAEAYVPESRKPEVAFADGVEVDLSRRDFTVNAMALRLPDLELIDPFGGAAHLHDRRLRTPLAPEESFTDDPLRMLRAARFIAQFHLLPDPGITTAVVELRERLAIVSAERIRVELDKLVTAEDPTEGLRFLLATGLADHFLPELAALALQQDPVHRHKDVLEHTFAVVQKVDPAHRLVRLAALFHDIGKPRTRAFGPGGVSFHHHEIVGARMTRDRMRALRYPNDDVAAVTRLVELHLRFHGYRDGDGGWTDSAVRRYVRDAGPLLEALNELTRCDCTTRNVAKARGLARRMDELEERIKRLEAEEELKALRPDIDGQRVMEHLGIAPGPVVGKALAFLLETRIEEGPLGEEEALRRLDEWWAEHKT
ncbi:MAG TPA: CCA tRNA nucleotidyltransferase [Acidimicrobiales bacterium]|nr:CCA tRNA nucleotidyltransferase [Acidimicrobiales bacterium]